MLSNHDIRQPRACKTIIRGVAFGLFLTGAATLPCVAGAGLAVTGYQIVGSNRIGGVGGWDYLTLDASGRRLFITRSDRVDVYDARTAKVVGSVMGTNGVHGVALAEDRDRGYTSNGRGNSVTVFELSTLKVLREVALPGQNPDAIVYEPTGKRVFTFNGKSKDATVLDAVSSAVTATLPMPGKPEFAVDDRVGHIYVNIENEPGQIVVVDTKQLSVSATWTLPGCNAPTGLALDRTNRRLFSVCQNNVMAVTDATDGKPIAKVNIGDWPDAVAYDAELGVVLSSNGDGTLTVVRQVSLDRYEVASTLPTAKGARTLALDAKTHRVYLVSSDFGETPKATAEQPHPRPPQVPDSFTVLVAAPR
jgi:DNA-binding beta-propeller fold protein YncE